jgi:proline dehydrogenase
MDEAGPSQGLDLENTQVAFEQKSDKELKWMKLLFLLMNNGLFVNVSTGLAMLALKLRLPFAKTIIKKTIFEQFVGGETLLDCQKTIEDLYKFNSLTILDYGAESKSDEEELEKVKEETLNAIDLAASNFTIPVVSTKITGLVNNEVLYKLNDKKELSTSEQRAFDKLMERLHTISKRAEELGVGVFIDAEESWMQDAIDDLVNGLMAEYNKKKAIIYNTIQLYRWDRLDYLKTSHKNAIDGGYILGVKLVRGAYMEKERERAEELSYKSPIQKDKKSTDEDYDSAIEYCVKNYQTIASCCASHNMKSNLLQARLIDELEIPKEHPHVNFCQLYGMSDYITFNIAAHGYNVAKYVPYGPVDDVIPYLIRRARENTAVSGEMSREFNYISKELKRRGL